MNVNLNLAVRECINTWVMWLYMTLKFFCSIDILSSWNDMKEWIGKFYNELVGGTENDKSITKFLP